MEMPAFLEKKYIGPVKGWHIVVIALGGVAFYLFVLKKKQTATAGTQATASTAGGVPSPSSYVGGGGYPSTGGGGNGYILPIPGSVSTIPSAPGTATNPPSSISPNTSTPTTTSVAQNVPIAAAPAAFVNSAAQQVSSAANAAYTAWYNNMFVNPSGGVSQYVNRGSPLQNFIPNAPYNQNYLAANGYYSQPMGSYIGSYVAPNTQGYNYSGTPIAVGGYQRSSLPNVYGYYVTLPGGGQVFQT